MMIKKRLNDVSLLEGIKYLTERDGDLAEIVSQYGPPPLWNREPGFHTLIHIILEQQVSLGSAKAAYNRLIKAVHPLTPVGFLKLSDEDLRRIGFSRQKTVYGRELATAILRGRLDLLRLEELDDEQVKTELMKVKGIGEWTADIYLLMAMGRPDIWPKGDLALEVAVQKIKGYAERPTAEEMIDISKDWHPSRAVAARLLWHFYLNEKQNTTSARV